MMAKIKFCGLTRAEDIRAVNRLKADYAGFVFWPKSKRYVTRDKASELSELLSDGTEAVGVFVDEDIKVVAGLLDDGIIDIAQLHGSEPDDYIRELQKATSKKVIKAFRVRSEEDIIQAEQSPADYVLLDAGMGGGVTFDWTLLKEVKRPYFLAGGLHPGNASEAVRMLDPYALDVSSGIETEGIKDERKMAAFTDAVRKEDQND